MLNLLLRQRPQVSLLVDLSRHLVIGRLRSVVCQLNVVVLERGLGAGSMRIVQDWRRREHMLV